MSYPTIEIIGGGGGSAFSFTGQDNGASLENIWVWVGGWQVKAVKVQLSDGRCETFGQPYGSCAEYKFRPGECFSSLSLWGNGAGSRLGAIKFSTNFGGTFFAHMTSWGLKTEYPIDVGSGYCLGVMGRCGHDVDSMGFMFISPVQSAVLIDVDYPTLKQMKPQVIVEELKTITYQNDSSTIQQQTINTEKKVRNESSWSKDTRITATFDFEVKAGIPKLAEVSAEFHFSVGTTSTYSQKQKDERNETLSFPLNIPPGKKVDVIITIGRAVFDLPYTGTLKITCKNGSVLQYNIKGTYNGITYTDIKVDTKESDL